MGEVQVDERDELSMIKFNSKVSVAEMDISNPTVRDTTLVFDAVGASEFPVYADKNHTRLEGR